jgi:hypothetical protein
MIIANCHIHNRHNLCCILGLFSDGLNFCDFTTPDGRRFKGGEEVKLSPYQAVKAHRVVRRRGSHIFQTISSEMAVRLSASCAGRPLPPGRFLVLISVRG